MFKYSVNYYDEFLEKQTTEYGLISVKNFGKAADKVRRFYGKDNILSLTLEPLEDILMEEDIKTLFTKS